ncbi:MAG: PAS domain-containing protein [Prevotella sp.]|nr:PAS domain-containing protein [Prevotella sp.]
MIVLSSVYTSFVTINILILFGMVILAAIPLFIVNRQLAITTSKNRLLKAITHYVEHHESFYQEEQPDTQLAELGKNYKRAFESTLSAMSFYTPDGTLIDTNESMRKLCNFDDNGDTYYMNVNMFDTPDLEKDFERDRTEEFHVCQHMYLPEIGIDQYIEAKIRPVFDNEGNRAFYMFAARDITDERKTYLEQQHRDKELQAANTTILEYESELRYLLESSRMFVWHTFDKEGIIHFSQSLRDKGYTETFEEYLSSINISQRQQAAQALGELLSSNKPLNTVHFFNHTFLDDKSGWYLISGVPFHDEDGKKTGYMGIVKDVSELMEAQEKLKEETLRAENSGRLKSAFLANMTHEIRTPLNAIVGFSDLLQMVDVPEDRQEFIRIIRNNCDMLMRLIDDILEASDMNQGPQSIHPEDVDFALAFNDICETLRQRVQDPNVAFIADNTYQSFNTCIDKGRIQQVVTNFVTNAMKYTKQGHIKVGYQYTTCPNKPDNTEKGLYIYCEDTGAGIPKERQADVFKRFVKLNDFVQGTGLGLSISKSIAERCNGDIGVISEGEGHGSTFWLWIPCQLKG